MTPVVTMASAVVAAAPRTMPAPASKGFAQTLRHPDVYLPLIAAVLVLLVLVAWAP